MKSRIAVLAGIIGLAIAAPAQAAPQTFYFDCTGALPLQTVDVESYSWSPTVPASFQDGAGCGFLDPPVITSTVQPSPLWDAGYGGGYKGEVRKLQFTLYAPISSATKAINLVVIVDGEAIATLPTLKPVVGPGPNAAIPSFTYTVPGLDVPSGADDKYWQLAVSRTYANDDPGWLHGAKEVPANVKFFALNDLTPEEQEEILLAEEEGE